MLLKCHIRVFCQAWAEAEKQKGEELNEDEKWAAGIELLRATGDEVAANRPILSPSAVH